MDGVHRSIPHRASLSATDFLVFRVLRLRFHPEERIAVGNEIASLEEHYVPHGVAGFV